MPVSSLAGYIISLATIIVSLILGLGVIGNETAQIIISTVGPAVGIVFAILNQMHVTALIKAGAK